MSNPTPSSTRGGRRAAPRTRNIRQRRASPVVGRPGERTGRGLLLWLLAVLAGVAAVGAAALGDAPAVLGGIGAIVVSGAYTWALAARTGGRPAIFGALAVALGAMTLIVDTNALRAGAAVMTVVAAAVLSVVATVPAVTTPRAIGEAAIAVCLAVAGSVAAVGYEPEISPTRFTYVTLGLSLALVLVLVWRLGAGWHGLGRRGLVMVLVGSAALAVLVTYGELFRRYGTSDLVDQVFAGRDWARENLGGAPRPLQSLLGIPALVWGTHMRARRRQGWWVCAFGVAGTASIAPLLAESGMGLTELLITETGGLLIGGVIGAVTIAIDVALTGGRVSSGKRSRRSAGVDAVRPEPARTSPLL
ncbi:MAG: hypothetical protein V9G04_18595 [Nocardioides sp.]|jgi:hypothetical protein